MLNITLVNKLNEQVNLELYSSLLYQQMGGWCSCHGFKGTESFLYHHSKEEMIHMRRLFNYLTDTGNIPKINGINDLFPLDYSSLNEIFHAIYKHEQIVTKKINEITHIAISNQDYLTFNFLQWYITEQYEEEKLFKLIIDKFSLVKNSEEGIFFIDKEIEKINIKN